MAACGLLAFAAICNAADTPQLERCDLAAYRQHLAQLSIVVRACQARPSPSACGPAQVGPDDEVDVPQGTRLVHYGWLRNTLTTAGKSAATAGKPGDAARVQLTAAALRLAQDEGGDANAVAQTAGVAPLRTNLTNILVARRFQRIQEDPSLLRRAWVAVINWIGERLSKVAAYGGRNPWIAHILEGAAIIVPCVLLTWWVMVRLRRQAAAPKMAQAPAPTAPSAREWQRWLAEAESFAQAGNWREAVHHVYWATISRLEASGLWPADRARTPREYLGLLRAGHTLQTDLRGLTRSFELVWYGNRPAAEEQYRDARARMDRLVPR